MFKNIIHLLLYKQYIILVYKENIIISMNFNLNKIYCLL